MTLTTTSIPIPLRADENGVLRVGNTRITLDLLVEAFENGDSPEYIVSEIDTLDLGDVYAIKAFYLHHRDEVDAYLAEMERKYGEINRMLRAKSDASPLHAR